MLLLAASCAPKSATLTAADADAKRGDWEKALAEYQKASAANPSSNLLLTRVDHAEHELARLDVKRGQAAFAAGKLDEASDWWRKALELRPHEDAKDSARAAIGANALALEKFADESAKAKQWEKAFKTYGVLSAAMPERGDFEQKDQEAHKAFAAELDGKAGELAHSGLSGAALAYDLRALHHDPLHPGAFSRSRELRKQLAQKSVVGVSDPQVDDAGTGLGAVLFPRVDSRMGQYPPYGPARGGKPDASLSVTVESFDWWDATEHGVDVRHDKTPGSPKQSIANPEKAAWQKVVTSLQGELKMLQMRNAQSIQDSIAASGPPKKKGKSEAPKPASTPRPPTQADLDAKQKQIDDANARIAALPDQVEVQPGETVWAMPYATVTRTVSAKVRFDLKDGDFPDVVTMEKESTQTASDRSDEGDAAHGANPKVLSLPSVAKLEKDLADDLAGGMDVLKLARERRTKKLLDQAAAAQDANKEDDALDAYVLAAFAAGHDATLPDDATRWVATRMDDLDPKQIVAGP